MLEAGEAGEAGNDAGLSSQDCLSGLTGLRLGGPLTAGPALRHTAGCGFGPLQTEIFRGGLVPGSAATVPATEAVAMEKAGLPPSMLKSGAALVAFTGGPEGWKRSCPLTMLANPSFPSGQSALPSPIRCGCPLGADGVPGRRPAPGEQGGCQAIKLSLIFSIAALASSECAGAPSQSTSPGRSPLRVGDCPAVSTCLDGPSWIATENSSDRGVAFPFWLLFKLAFPDPGAWPRLSEPAVTFGDRLFEMLTLFTFLAG